MARKTTRQIGEVARSFFTEVEARQAIGGVNVIGLSTGYDMLDDMTGGLQSDQMWLIGARTSVGKTAFALGMGLHVAKSGVGTLFYSLEMRGEMLVNRLLAAMTDIPAGRIIRGKLDDNEMKQIARAIEEMESYKLAIIDKTITSEGVIEESMRVAEKTDVGLVLVDYAGILADKSGLGDVQRLTEISQNLRKLARPDYLDAPVVVLTQLNRMSEMREDHRPSISDIRGSDAFAQDAEVVLFPFRPYLYERMKGAEALPVEKDAEIIVAKNRNGPTGTTRANFYPKSMTWEQKHPAPVEPQTVSLVEKVRKGRAN